MSEPVPIGAIVFILLGAWMLLAQGHFSAWMERRHQQRLADRHARGQDAYFEELREIRAYPPHRIPPFQRKVGGALLIILGVSTLGLSITT